MMDQRIDRRSLFRGAIGTAGILGLESTFGALRTDADLPPVPGGALSN